MEILTRPTVLVAAVLILGGLLAGLFVLRASQARRGSGRGAIRDIAKLVRQGDYLRAAYLAARHGRYEEAIDYCLRAGEPLRAAHIAARTDDARRAAELYRQGGDLERAAKFYERAGMPGRAAELRRELGARNGEPAAPHERPDAIELAGEEPEKEEAGAGRRDAEGAAGGEIEDALRVPGLDAEAAEATEATDATGSSEPRETEATPPPTPLEDPPPGPTTPSETPPAAAPDVPAPRGGTAPDVARVEAALSAMTRPSPSELGLTADQISAITRQVAEATREQARREAVAGGIAEASVAARARVARTPGRAVGLERRLLSLETLSDDAVAAARGGPSIEALRAHVGDRECDLQNIEVYHRLGLAYLAQGRWAEARASFDAVEETSPGYRDAAKRAEQIRAWWRAVGPRLSLAPPPSAPGAAPRRYEILGELGRGELAVVYRAHDDRLGRDVAFKLLDAKLTTRREARETFQREVGSVAGLDHPHIVAIRDSGLLAARAFVSMEYVDGLSVQELLDQRGRLSVVEALRITCQVLDALEHAHGRRILHRDVRPSNMMRTRAGLVQLTDFGLAGVLASDVDPSLVAGSTPYLPGERLRGGDGDHRADLFAVGCSLFEMLTGALPFEGGERARAPASVTSHDPSLPDVLDAILRRALAAAPEDRFPSAAEFAAPIRRILDVVDAQDAGDAGDGIAKA